MDSHYGTMSRVKLFGRGRSVHSSLGGGKGSTDIVSEEDVRSIVADLLLWKDKKVSGAVLAGVALVWFLFEVVEYNFATLLCHITITAMLILFIWSTTADIFKWAPPKIPKIIIQDSSFNETASILHSKCNHLLSKLLYVACGNEPKFFLLAIISLFILSVIGNYISTLNLVFFGILCLETLPFLYDRYEDEVDDLASKIYSQMIRTYNKFEADVLGKIPHASVRDKDT